MDLPARPRSGGEIGRRELAWSCDQPHSPRTNESCDGAGADVDARHTDPHVEQEPELACGDELPHDDPPLSYVIPTLDLGGEVAFHMGACA